MGCLDLKKYTPSPRPSDPSGVYELGIRGDDGDIFGFGFWIKGGTFEFYSYPVKKGAYEVVGVKDQFFRCIPAVAMKAPWKFVWINWAGHIDQNGKWDGKYHYTPA